MRSYISPKGHRSRVSPVGSAVNSNYMEWNTPTRSGGIVIVVGQVAHPAQVAVGTRVVADGQLSSMG